MKTKFNVIILLGFIFCSLVSVCAQEKTISEQVLNALKDAANEKMKKKNYRVVMTSNHFNNKGESSPYFSVNEVFEYIFPDREHSINEKINEKGTIREETISIGEKKYVKRNNEKWKELPQEEKGGIGGFTTTEVLDHGKKVEIKYFGKKIIKNQNTDLYEIKTTRKYENPNFRSTTYIERFWFNKDGMFLKRETESEVDKGRLYLHIIWEYEYDPKNLKIEAPIK